MAGTEGDFDTLFTKARFEETKLRELGGESFKPRKPLAATNTPRQPDKSSEGSSGDPPCTSQRGPKCFGCGFYGHFKNKCPNKSKAGPAETPGKKRPNAILPDLEPPRANDSHGPDDVDLALQKVTATLHTLSPKEPATQLGPVPTAEVELEGEKIEALLDTGSPATIVSFEYLLQVLAKRRPPNQSPEEWQKQVKKRLEPTSVALRNYGGGQLPVVRQIRATLSRAGRKVEAVVQVQKDAPAKLLLGTDLLAGLSFAFVSNVPEKDEVNLLEQGSSGKSSSDPGKDGSTVCLVWAARVPAQHGKLVRAHVSPGLHSLSLFEPNSVDLQGKGLIISEAVVELDDNDCMVVVVENHGCEPVLVDAGQVLLEP